MKTCLMLYPPTKLFSSKSVSIQRISDGIGELKHNNNNLSYSIQINVWNQVVILYGGSERCFFFRSFLVLH